MDDLIVVEVFGGTCVSSCDTCAGGCIVGSSGPRLEQEVQLLKHGLENHYGSRVKVEYIDTDQTGLKDYPNVARAVRAGHNFPIIAIMGRPRLAGGIDIAMIREILEEDFQ